MRLFYFQKTTTPTIPELAYRLTLGLIYYVALAVLELSDSQSSTCLCLHSAKIIKGMWHHTYVVKAFNALDQYLSVFNIYKSDSVN